MVAGNIFLREILAARADAVASVPQRWIEFCPTYGKSDSKWDVLGEDCIIEIVNSVSKKRTKGDPSIGVSFQKAALSLIALDIALKCKGSCHDIYETVKICPIIYIVQNFYLEHWSHLSHDAQKHIRENCEQSEKALTLLAGGHRPVSFNLARRVSEILTQIDGNRIFEIALHSSIGKPTYLVKPNHMERMSCLIAQLGSSLF